MSELTAIADAWRHVVVTIDVAEEGERCHCLLPGLWLSRRGAARRGDARRTTVEWALDYALRSQLPMLVALHRPAHWRLLAPVDRWGRVMTRELPARANVALDDGDALDRACARWRACDEAATTADRRADRRRRADSQ